jgi:hypothetical protein
VQAAAPNISHGKPKQGGRRDRDDVRTPGANLDRLVEALMEPVGREARRRASEAIRL